MAFPEFIKIQAVKYYMHSKSAKEVSLQVKQEFGIDISARSIQSWAKDEDILRSAGGPPSLFMQSSININNLRANVGQKFDIKDFVEQNKRFFDKTSQMVDEILAALYNSVSVEQIRDMDIKDKLNAIAKLEKLKMEKYNFILNIIARSADEEEDLVSLLGEIVNELNGVEQERLPEVVDADQG